MHDNNRFVVAAGVLVALAVLALTGYLVSQLSGTSPAVTAAVLTAFGGVLAALPPIIRAFRGGR